MKKGKIKKKPEGNEISNQESNREYWKQTTSNWKYKKKKIVLKNKDFLKANLYRRNLIKGLNASADPLVRYSVLFLKWTTEEVREMNQRARKLMTMRKTLHPRDDVNKIYV